MITKSSVNIEVPDGIIVQQVSETMKTEIYIRVPKHLMIKDPIQIVYRAGHHFQTVVSAEEGSEVKIVERFVGGENGSETYATAEISLGEGSLLDHFRLQEEENGTNHEGCLTVGQTRSSRFRSYVYNLGGKKSRSEIKTGLNGEGASCELYGLFSAGDDQQVDNQTAIDHAVPHGTSTELYKGILSGTARGIFNGKIIVRPNAQKTEARQMNKNLLLSKEAMVHSQPFLEILNNDVKCNHGATIGRLDEQALFYLRSRGIGEFQAKVLLTHAFAAELTNPVPWPDLKKTIERALARRLGREFLLEV